ncbi:GOLPH3/VPS74 family protein [Pilimelia columellifera]|uniref:GPP34 family phosphoprotein n=1 Tax=Pilimelia columellifera subsp. columellifera TaxID=706583 RepID=A0ABP6B1R8_9ACTN
MAVPNSLPQRIYLLAYNPDKGKVGTSTELGAMLRAGALADLYLNGQLIDVRGRAAINGQHLCSDPILAGLLEEIARSKPRKWQHWIDKRQRATVNTVRQQLDDGGWARCQRYKILGLFPATKVTLRDPRVRKELLSRVNNAFRSPTGRVDPADAALVTIAAAAELKLVLDRKTRRDNKRRIQELAKTTGPIGPALHKSIQAAASGASGA